MQWAAVVVNYEAGHMLLACVHALVGSELGPVEIVVVDNGSEDGSVAMLERDYPGIAIVRPGANLGYGRAANLGIAATTAPVIAVLNPDVEVENGAAAHMLNRFVDDPRLAALGPAILNTDGSLYPSARRAPGITDAIGHALLGRIAPGNRFTRAYRELDADPEIPRDVDWLSGAAVWLRRDALDVVGGWDEEYFMFFEDVDLCRRLNEAGWRVSYEPAACVTHVVGVSRAGRPYRSIYWHHRAAYRYAANWWQGRRRLLLPGAAIFLAARGLAQGLRESVRTRPKIEPVTE
ncbi:MAG: glycosyltransferase family 2 protein [Acidimicrobiia bacterium]|nr:glycosyltransferase family 2 protein [Acidimicrobiia bacterium]